MINLENSKIPNLKFSHSTGIAPEARSATRSANSAARHIAPHSTDTRFAFTQRLIDGLPVPLKRTYYYDTRQRGLVLTVFPTGRKTFSLYRWIAGRPERITIGPYPDLTIEQARARAAELNGAIAQGANPARERAAIRDEMTLEELFQDYLEKHSKIHKRTWKSDVSMFSLHLHSLRLHKISEVSKSDLAALHRRIGRRGPYAANRVMELLSSMFNWAKEESGWKGENPAAGIKAFKEHKRQRFLDADELPRFFQSLAQEENTTIRDFILISLLIGARRSNIQSMRWDEIHWRRAVWEIPATKSKSNEPIDVMLVPVALELLRRRQAAPDTDPTFVFPGVGASGHLVEVKSAFSRLLKRAGIRNCRLHDLRRTLGSWQALEGASLTIIGASLGHKSLAATAVYARLNTNPIRQSVSRAVDAMLHAGQPPQGLLLALPAKSRDSDRG